MAAAAIFERRQIRRFTSYENTNDEFMLSTRGAFLMKFIMLKKQENVKLANGTDSDPNYVLVAIVT